MHEGVQLVIWSQLYLLSFSVAVHQWYHIKPMVPHQTNGTTLNQCYHIIPQCIGTTCNGTRMVWWWYCKS